MIYILIVMWLGQGSAVSGKAALAVEFNDRLSCEAAATEIRRQERVSNEYNSQNIGTILCAAKGKP